MKGGDEKCGADTVRDGERRLGLSVVVAMVAVVGVSIGLVLGGASNHVVQVSLHVDGKGGGWLWTMYALPDQPPPDLDGSAFIGDDVP